MGRMDNLRVSNAEILEERSMQVGQNTLVYRKFKIYYKGKFIVFYVDHRSQYRLNFLTFYVQTYFWL